MAILENFTNSTELEAVNTVLVSSGETPLTSSTVLANQTAPDVLSALDILKKVTKELQLEPWKFNTEDGRRYAPIETNYLWTNNDLTSAYINIFLDPNGEFTSWELTPCKENRDLDVFVRLSENDDYAVAPGQNLPVIYDRLNHRDGPVADKHPYLYLDVQYALDFALLPEVARRYVSVVASRRFAQQLLGSAERGTFSREDEIAALRLLKREQGRPRKYNFLNNMEILETMGRPTVSYPYERKLRNK